MKRNRSWVLSVMLLLAAIVSIAPAPTFATAPTVASTTTGKVVSNTATSSGLAFTSGQVALVAVMTEAASFQTVTTITDGGDTFTQIASYQNASVIGGQKDNAEIWAVKTGLSGTHSVVITLTGSATLAYFFLLVNNANTADVDCTAHGSKTTGTTIQTYTSCPYNTATMLPVAVMLATSMNSGTGYTKLANAGSTAYFLEYSLGTAASPTNFPATQSSGPWMELGVILVSESGTVVVPVVGPCTFFQLQCWWYPFLFMGLYSGFLLMVSTQLKTSPRGKTHIFLSAVTMGSLIAVILGIMNIVFPLLMLLLNTLIVLRTR